MTFTEGGANPDIGKKKIIESKKPPVKNKESFVGVKKPLTKLESLKPKVETSLMKEIQKSFPKLSKQWVEKIASSYKQFSSESVTKFFGVVKKNNTKDYPQSLIATSLIQYAKNTHDGVLSVENYQTYLQSLVDEHIKLKSLYATFATKNDPVFIDFKRFKATYKQPTQTIDQITQGKGFTNDTYVFFQYLSSKSFQDNQTSILGSLSQNDRRQFHEYMKSDVRLSQKIGYVASADLVKNDAVTLESQSQEKGKEGSFADAKTTFMNDVNKENGPKQIVDDVDQTVFGAEWLEQKDMKDIFTTLRNTLTKTQREALLERYSQLIPKKMNKQKFIDFCMGTSSLDKRKEVMYRSVFDTIVKKGLQPQTKADIQQHVMDVYFEQVAGILKAGGDIVQTSGVEYNKDGTIDMKYSTPRGIQGTIHISPTGEVTILDMFAFHNENEKGNNQNIIEKIQNKLMDGRLPSMKEMMSRSSSDKSVIFDAWVSKISSGSNEKSMLIDKQVVAPNMITDEEEHSRNILDISMNKMLSMTQTADRLGSFIDHTYKVLGLPQNDIYTKYLKGEVAFLDTKTNSDLEGLFALRSDFLSNDTHITTFNKSLDVLLKTYQNNSVLKENYPFGTSEIKGKETLFQFISRFCISEKEFDIVSFENCIQKITTQKPNLPSSVGEFHVDNPTYFPLKSLYLARYHQEDIYNEKEKTKNDYISSTRKALVDLKTEIQMGIDLDKINTA